MNQILVTQKMYITPEMKRKKIRYKVLFFVSVFMLFLLFLYYICTEYDKSKSEEVSKYILADYIATIPQEEDTTVRNIINDVLIVSLDSNEQDQTNSQFQQEHAQEQETEQGQNQEQNQEQIQQQVYMASDGTKYTAEAILNIPSLEIKYPVLSETTEELLKISLNKYWGPHPNEIGNYCIVGHNYRNGTMFGKLSEIGIGDKVSLTDSTRKTYTYSVYNKYVVSPSDVKCTSQLTGGRRELTLITCTNYGTQRLVVKCTQI